MNNTSELSEILQTAPHTGTAAPDASESATLDSSEPAAHGAFKPDTPHQNTKLQPTATYKPVKALDPETARKIAAGEVIDRPAAVIRELLDNAIDAGASKIQVELTGGGIDRIRVTDNGCGMSREDLVICTDTHTTSKISSAEDLLSLRSLGFRGEALSSIKAVSNLEIISTQSGPAAWKLQFGKISPARLPAGTTVQVENLFENFPARKQFLKRAATETALCRSIFLDKALPHYQIEMRFIADGTLRFLLPPSASLRERCLDAFSFKEPEKLFFEIEGSGEYFSFRAVLGSPGVIRNDKRAMMVFVNGRRITEFGLVQAIEYGSEGYFPNGGHPVAFLFLTVAPSRVDFNIHPAKKEARFQDYSAIHNAISSAVGSFYRQHTVANLLKEKYNPELTRPLDFRYGESAPPAGVMEQEKIENGGFGHAGSGGQAGFTGNSVRQSRNFSNTLNKDDFNHGGSPHDSLQPDAGSYSAWSERNRLYAESLALKHGFFKQAYPQAPRSGTVTDGYAGGENGDTGGQDGSSGAAQNSRSNMQNKYDTLQSGYGSTQGGHGSAFKYIAAQAQAPYSGSGHVIPPPAALGKAPYMQNPQDIPPADFKLLGQVAGTFIAVEKNDSLYLIDQHAAHERIIFEQLRQNAGGVQELLIPYRIITSSEEEDAFIRAHCGLLCKAGFALSDEGAGIWQVTAVPARWTGTERDLICDITGVRKNAGDMLYQVLASAACRAACKDHAILDPVTQQRIAARAFELPEPICPHGRPIWILFTREELFKRVKRT